MPSEKNLSSDTVLTLAAIPPTNMRFGTTVPYLGAWVPLRGVVEGVGEGETSPEED